MKKPIALIAVLTFSLGAAAQGMSSAAVQAPMPVPARVSVAVPDAASTAQPKKAVKAKKTKKALKAIKAKSVAKVKASKASKKAKKAKKRAKTPKLMAKKGPAKTLH